MMPLLIITGMHRTGTSFLARALNLYGTYLGELDSILTHDWHGIKENPRGHWENKKILELTEKTLEFSNCTWDNVSQEVIIDEKIGKEINHYVVNLLKNTSLAAGFKDPRLILCLDSWQKYLPKNFLIIGIFRHPLKVAESLKTRNNFSYEKSLKLWYIYNKKLLDILEKHSGFLLDFDWSKEKLLSEIDFIATKIGLVKGTNLKEWYTEDLFRSDKSYDKNFPISGELNEIYTKLKKRSKKNYIRSF